MKGGKKGTLKAGPREFCISTAFSGLIKCLDPSK